MSGAKTNPIRKAHVDQDYALAASGVSTSDEKAWYAVCPVCEERIMHRRGYPSYARATRKNTKDALHWHTMDRHKPGLVGTP